MKIYTKQGDEGLSSLFDGTRVPKNHPRLVAYSTLDELNSHLGLAIAQTSHVALQTQLQALQHRLFDLGADLATPPGSRHASKVRRIGPEDVVSLERQIDDATAQLLPIKYFILPGGSVTAAQLHIARTVCRRAERHLVALIQSEPPQAVGPQTLIFVNRLSDLLFTLARLANKLDGRNDVEWLTEK